MIQPYFHTSSARSASRVSAGYHVKPKPRARARSSQPQPWLLGTVLLAALALVPQEVWSRISGPILPQSTQAQSAQPWQFDQARSTVQTCQTVLNGDQRLSRGQLTQFLAIAQNASQASEHAAIAPPYCTLSRAHQVKQSEAYPLAFDPDTWFVVNYEQGVYKGYDFVFKK